MAINHDGSVNTEVKEVTTLEDVQLIVDDFYGKIRMDDLLGDIFDNIIQDRWPEHIEKMYTFWQTVLLGENTYTGAPFVPHAHLPVDQEHFDRWLSLFDETVDNYFIGERAEKAKWQGHKMAEIFLDKIRYIRGEID